MIRRSFLSHLGTVAVTTVSPSLLKSSPFAAIAETEESGASKGGHKIAAELSNGPGTVRFINGPSGMGLEFSIQHHGQRRVVASVANPVRIFYDRRGNGTEKNVEFSKALTHKDGIVTSAELVDARNNRWLVRLEVSKWNDDGFRCEFNYELLEGVAKNVFLEHGVAPALAASPEGTYVFMPGLLYDGNHRSRPDGEIPRLVDANHYQLDTPALTLSATATMLFEKATGVSLVTKTDVATSLGPSGFSYAIRPGMHQLAIVAPLYREKHFRGHHYDECTPEGAHVNPGGRVKVVIYHRPAHYASLVEMFAAFHDLREPVPFVRTPKLPMSKAVELIEKNFNEVDWCAGNYYINASPPTYDPVKNGCDSLPMDWHLITGWCAGAITGYALLQADDELSRKRSRAMFDLIATGGVSPSGLFWSNYGKGKWDTGNTPIAMHQHMRMPGDATFFFQKSLALEKTRDHQHPEWERAVISNLDAFTKLWHDNQDFGHFVNRETLKIEQTGSAAGALCIGDLALGATLPNGKDYLSVAREAAHAYFKRYVETGWLVGGPLDIGIAPDSESATAILESFVTLYEADRDPRFLKYAEVAADILSSWVVSYNAPFPSGTDCDRIALQTVGGVLANSRNHHIGPTMATSSGDMFFRLYRYTGKPVYLRILQEVVSGLPQYLCYKPDSIGEMRVGAMSEQYNMTDELGTRGHIWQVNASWGATGLLLSYRALPSIYIDRSRRNFAVFDQLSATPDFDGNRLSIANGSPYDAALSIATEDGHQVSLTLSAGQSKMLSLESLVAIA